MTQAPVIFHKSISVKLMLSSFFFLIVSTLAQSTGDDWPSVNIYSNFYASMTFNQYNNSKGSLDASSKN